jgi:hypothetical protein
MRAKISQDEKRAYFRFLRNMLRKELAASYKKDQTMPMTPRLAGFGKGLEQREEKGLEQREDMRKRQAP